MDEQTTPATEPVAATPDPAATDTPTVLSPQVEEVVQAPAEGISVHETPQTEPLSEPIPTPAETSTPQMEGNEALSEITTESPMPTTTPNPEASQPEETSPKPEEPAPPPPQTQQGITQPEPPPPQESPTPARAQIISPAPNILKLLLTKANLTIKLRRQKKLPKVMTLFVKKTHITNDDVEKLLHVSDATALRYLTQLMNENKIVRVGTTGQGVTYTKR